MNGRLTEDQPNIKYSADKRGALPVPVARRTHDGVISSESEIQIYPRLRPAWPNGTEAVMGLLSMTFY